MAGLVALLPPHLRDRQYTTYRLAPGNDVYLSVGLVYDDQQMRRGNPPNVGLDFDAETGALVRIHEDRIGLGLK